MQVTLGGQERTLPELRSLAESAGWRLIRVARTEGSLFAYVVAEPGPIPSGSALGVLSPSIATLPIEDAEEEIPPAMQRRTHGDENDARRGPTGPWLTTEKGAPSPPPGGQNRGLLKKVSLYFSEGS